MTYLMQKEKQQSSYHTCGCLSVRKTSEHRYYIPMANADTLWTSINITFDMFTNAATQRTTHQRKLRK